MLVIRSGFLQKNENAFDFLIEDCKNHLYHLEQWGSKPPTFMLCNGALTKQLTMNPEKTNDITAGPDGKRKLAQGCYKGPDLPSYRGLNFNSRKFSMEAGTAPRDMMRRRVRVAEPLAGGLQCPLSSLTPLSCVKSPLRYMLWYMLRYISLVCAQGVHTRARKKGRSEE